jgi:hypothetical protein
MPLILETGDLEQGANTYATLAEADAWLGARGFDSWPQPPVEPEPGEPGADPPPEPPAEPEPPLDAQTIAQKEAALVRATDYLNGLAWKGKRAAPGRIMAWPRAGVTDSDGYTITANEVPEAVKAACCYLAGQIFNGVDPQPVLERGNRIASESVGSLSTSYFENATARDVYSVLADLLRGLALEFEPYAGIGPGTAGRTMILTVKPGG